LNAVSGRSINRCHWRPIRHVFPVATLLVLMQRNKRKGKKLVSRSGEREKKENGNEEKESDEKEKIKEPKSDG